eukprot:CAMPEP_0195143634 /NCGR_PEP_ID=MMETSP0448-20130528/166700_1 /TAXON_ID=66468 /ORGANISM="Heterocapsa triquestra, Strain CCMP 448" /LENGTH=84 /DNA_ID=CAMNT_0040182073 /DNA_START=37 /DNA_END=287 /DNA_ORIENTATION=+
MARMTWHLNCWRSASSAAVILLSRCGLLSAQARRGEPVPFTYRLAEAASTHARLSDPVAAVKSVVDCGLLVARTRRAGSPRFTG